MTPQDWSRIQQGIFRGESGGDYGALFGYQNRPNGRFEGTDLTKMTVDQALDFAKPSGPYGQYVKGEVGRVATPMGAYQVVGTTLRDAKNALGLTGNEVMDQGLQDKIGQWIYKSQGTGAWEGYKPISGDQAIASDTMRVLGKQPKGLLATAKATDDTESKMIPEEKPKGLLGSLGIQKMVEGAEGEAGQRFYQRDTFKDTAAQMAPLLAAMGSSPALQKATAGIAAQRTEKKARNKSMEYLAGLPGGEEYVRIAEVAGPKAAMQAYLESKKAPKSTAAQDKIARLISTGVPENIAIGITDGRLVARQNDVTGETFVLDVATGQKVFDATGAGGNEVPIDQPASGLDEGSLAGLDPTKALAVTGYANSWLNTVADAFGQKLPAPKAAEASAAMRSLATRTIALAETEFAGKPTNFLRERVEKNFSINPDQISMGPRVALERSNVIIDMLQETVDGAKAVIAGKTATVNAKKSAMDSLPKSEALLRDYISLREALNSNLGNNNGAAQVPEDVMTIYEKYTLEAN
jgi:hypothetical protein